MNVWLSFLNAIAFNVCFDVFIETLYRFEERPQNRNENVPLQTTAVVRVD